MSGKSVQPSGIQVALAIAHGLGIISAYVELLQIPKFGKPSPYSLSIPAFDRVAEEELFWLYVRSPQGVYNFGTEARVRLGFVPMVRYREIYWL